MSVRLLVWNLLAILFFAGCAGPQRKLTPLYHEEIPPPVAPIQQPVQPVEVKPEPNPVVIEPAEVKPAITKPLTGWVSLQDWCAQNKLAAPLITADAGQTNIAIRSDNGVFAFEPPRRNARWNGILIGVGFSPVFTNHQTFVNAIDLNKVLQPLLLTNEAPRKHAGIVVIDAGHGGANEGAVSHD